MKIIHLHTGADGRSHLEERELRLTPGPDGPGIELAGVATGVAVRAVPSGWSSGYHNAPRRQLVIQLTGTGELICGDGSSRVVGPGDVVLADDRAGQGHISREVSGPRTQAVIELDPSADLSILFTPENGGAHG
jgi:hypothetical protein